jgi:hypothetical protein
MELASEGVMAHPGDPTPRSPVDTLSNGAWRAMLQELIGVDVVKLVVLHHGTETYWQVIYKAQDRGSPSQWHEVLRVTRQIVDYEFK